MEIEPRILGILGKDSITELDSPAMMMSNMMAFSVLLGLLSSGRLAPGLFTWQLSRVARG